MNFNEAIYSCIDDFTMVGHVTDPDASYYPGLVSEFLSYDMEDGGGGFTIYELSVQRLHACLGLDGWYAV